MIPVASISFTPPPPPPTPLILVQGNNQIIAYFPTNPLLTGTTLKLKIESFCLGSEHCIDYFDFEVPVCGLKSFDPNASKVIVPKLLPELNVMPNPANTEIFVNYRFNSDDIVNERTIHIFDAIGRPVKQIHIFDITNTYKLNVSNLAQGIYIIEIRENNKHILSKRIIINH
jgi:hypothetical protein